MKTFKEFIKEENAKIIEVMGEATFFEEKLFFAEEVVEMVERWQLLQQCNVSGALELLAQMLNERKQLAKQGFETWQELQMNSDSENALLRVMRLIGERQANDR